METGGLGLGDGVDTRLWPERGAGKAICLEEDGTVMWRHVALEATACPQCSGRLSSAGSEERNPVGLDSGSWRDMRMRVSAWASAHLHVLGGGWIGWEKAVNNE